MRGWALGGTAPEVSQPGAVSLQVEVELVPQLRSSAVQRRGSLHGCPYPGIETRLTYPLLLAVEAPADLRCPVCLAVHLLLD